jgi:hypothetical protein
MVVDAAHQVECNSTWRTVLGGLFQGIQQRPIVSHPLITRHPVFQSTRYPHIQQVHMHRLEPVMPGRQGAQQHPHLRTIR